MGILDGIKALFGSGGQPTTTPRTAARAPAPSLPPPPTSWIQQHTLGRCASKDQAVHVAGEGHYQLAIAQVAGGKTESGPAYRLQTAHLRPEPRNRQDRDAIAVMFESETVGYIPAIETHLWHPVIETIHRAGQQPTCLAEVTGGWNRGYGDEGSYGVVLHAIPHLRQPDQPTVPPSTSRKTAVIGEQDYQDTLADLIGPQVAQLAGEDGLITVYINARRVGQLSQKMTDRYVQLISDIYQAGLPVTCQALVERGKTKIEAAIYMTNPDYT